jgi:hypothetical protein
MSRRNVQGTIYLIHFPRPYKLAAHYLGWAEDLESWLADHQAGRGARLMAVIKAAGIDWKLTRTWTGDRHRERQLKNQGSSRRHCPECGVKPRKDTTMQTTLIGNATPAEAAELQDALEHSYQRAYQAAREADPWGSEHESRFQTATECNEVAADVVHETLENGMRRPGESTGDFLSRAKAEAQAAEGGRWDDGIYVRDLKELGEPGLTPGGPHPDPALAAKGWHVCGHGIYARHPGRPRQAEAEPEAC